MSKEAMKLKTAAEKVVALSGERPLSLGKWFIDMSEACESLREALAEQPAQRKPLTDEEIKQLAYKHLDVGNGSYSTHFVIGDVDFARAIEAAHGIKENT